MSELVAEQPQASAIPANPPLKRSQYLFTPEQGRALAAKAHESRRNRKIEQAQYLAKLESEAALAREIITANAIATKQPVALEPDETYRLNSLARTREQIEKLESKLDECDEPRDLKAIADAIARLRDVEQTLAKRPKPAAYRTAPEKPTKRSSVVEPED